MDPTTSYKHAIPLSVLARFDFFETRNAGSILRATNPEEFDDIISVLSGFAIDAASDISEAGGNESKTAARLNRSFRYLGWREAAYSITIKGELVVTSSPPLRTGLPRPVRRLTPPPDQMVDASQGRQLPVSLHVL